MKWVDESSQIQIEETQFGLENFEPVKSFHCPMCRKKYHIKLNRKCIAILLGISIFFYLLILVFILVGKEF